MQIRPHSSFLSIRSEGGLFPADLLQRILTGDPGLGDLRPEDYHLQPGEKLNEEISRAFSRLLPAWQRFQAERAKLEPGDPAASLTRERWLLPLFSALGFGRLSAGPGENIEGRSFPILYRYAAAPIHLIGCGVELDRPSRGVPGAARTSPHGLVQEYLNRKQEARWGLLSNGLALRLLRDNATLTRQAYLEFDLETMFDGEVYADFSLLWLICHQSRFEQSGETQTSPLDRWSLAAQQQGARALETLRQGVQSAIQALGSGFLRHPANAPLLARLRKGQLDRQDYYRQLLRLVYRLIFLFTAEDRGLLLDPAAPAAAKAIYLQHYAAARLRRLAALQIRTRHHDLYAVLKLVMDGLGSPDGLPALGLPALGGLFAPASLPDLAAASLENRDLLSAVASLTWLTEGPVRRPVDFRNLGAEELGSVYESLLELHPLLNLDSAEFTLASAAGNQRKTTGSYYTPTSLIQLLLDSALGPVIEEAVSFQPSALSQKDAVRHPLSGSDSGQRTADPAERLLSLKICDPACGSGHFLIAAAHRLAARLAQLRANGDEPSPTLYRRCLRDVIARCIYGVDLNEMAVELCKVNLWLEALEPGKPLSFLDAHIKCGNSLAGLGPRMRLDELVVPDEAFNPVTGDDKPTAALLKKRNKHEREGQESLFVTLLKTRDDLDAWLAQRAREVEQMPEDSAAMVQAKAAAYRALGESDAYRQQRQAADLWTAAFFWKIAAPGKSALEITAPSHGQLRRLREGRAVQPGLLEEVERLRRSVDFFHWPLEFSEVFHPSPSGRGTEGEGAFSCILGNPPWERIKLQEEEFFAQRDPQIAAAPNKAARQKLIDALASSNPALAQAFEDARHAAEASSKFVRAAGRYPLTAVGDVNTYALFAEHNRSLTSPSGRAGIIVPTGIATDDTTKDFFGGLVEKRSIASLYDFENREKLFPAVDSRMKFCLLTLSGAPVQAAQFAFFATRVEHLQDRQRRFSLNPAEIALFNPNTRTMPVFRTRADAELTRAIYQRVPVLVDERKGENPWGVSFLRMFDMSNDSHLFATEPREGYVRLYEGKYVWHFDHRWGTQSGNEVVDIRPEEKKNPNCLIDTRYYVHASEVKQRIAGWNKNWFVGFRDITNATNERTVITSIIPKVGVGNKFPEIFFSASLTRTCCFVAALSSMPLDYISRQKIAGTTLNFFIFKQIPVLIPTHYSQQSIKYVASRVIELTYTAYDLQPFAQEILDEIGADTWNAWFPYQPLSYPSSPPAPFAWDEERRAVLRAELDAYYARLYGLNRKQLRYILDPADLTPRELEDILDPWEEVSDPLDPAGYDARRTASGFPGETFRVLKEKEFRQHGEYRTRRLVLEAWGRLEGEAFSGQPAPSREGLSAVSQKEDGRGPGSGVRPDKRETVAHSSADSGRRKAESEKSAVRNPLSGVREEPKPVELPSVAEPGKRTPDSVPQPSLADWGMYKCSLCGKMVMGYEKDAHQEVKHAGKSVEWRKVG